jgi:hypothetical protein
MLEVQLEHFKKTPLLTNPQPDFSRASNDPNAAQDGISLAKPHFGARGG